MELLELDSLSNALVGSLDVEASKRLTIAVELAARPKVRSLSLIPLHAS